jgi:hypothetical protein
VLAVLVASYALARADYAPETPPERQPPVNREWPDGPNKEFLKNLMRPDNASHPGTPAWR